MYMSTIQNYEDVHVHVHVYLSYVVYLLYIFMYIVCMYLLYIFMYIVCTCTLYVMTVQPYARRVGRWGSLRFAQ